MNNSQDDINKFFDAFKELVESKPFAMREQYIFLNRFSYSVITEISHLCGLNPIGTKQIIIGNIVKQYFTKFYLGLGELRRNQITQSGEAYEDIKKWIPRTPELHTLRQEMLHLIDELHNHRFKLIREKHEDELMMQSQIIEAAIEATKAKAIANAIKKATE